MRGTLHLFPAAELPLWLRAFKQRQWPRFTPGWERYHGVQPDDLRRITAAVGEVLPGRVLTRDELATEIAAALRKPALAEKIRSGWGVMLKPAAAGGLLCFGPDRDRNVTFTDPRSHLTGLKWDDVDPDPALRPTRSPTCSSARCPGPRAGSRRFCWSIGVVAGTWSLDQRPGEAVITVDPFAAISAANKKAAAKYVGRYSRILDAEVEVRWTA